MTADDNNSSRKTMRKSKRAESPAVEHPDDPGKTSKLDRIVTQLRRPEGASLADLVAATGWQVHSVRGALAGSLKKKGLVIVSDKINGERRYRIGEMQ